MRKRSCNTTQCRRHRSPAGPFLVFALLSGLVIFPSSARGDYEYIPGLGGYLKTSSSIIGGVSTAVTVGQAIGKFLGILGSNQNIPTNTQILNYMKAIEKYEDREDKIRIMGEARALYEDMISTLYSLNSNQQLPSATQIDGWAMSGGGDASLTRNALVGALDPGGILRSGECVQIRQFQTPKLDEITGEKTAASTYDWRAGMGTALAAVAARLLAIKMYAPNFRYESRWAATDFIALIQCLKNHRDYIKPAVKPTPYCVNSNCGNSNNVLTCSETRDVDWKDLVTSATVPFPGCRKLATSTSEAEFTDKEETFASNTDYDKFKNVVFSLQKVIDALYLYAHSPAQTFAPPSNLKDLTEDGGHIFFGANAQFCLVQDGTTPKIAACSDATEGNYGTWTYDRGTGSIKNVHGNKCLAVQGRLPSATVQLAACEPTGWENSDEQTWSWNPESGVIRNAFGPVLAVTSAVTPGARVPVTVAPENPWHMDQQGWASSSSVCANGGPAFCPRKGSAVWNQGSVTMPNMFQQMVTQRFPLDTNTFTYEQLYGPIHVAGPIASAGSILPVNLYSYSPCGVEVNYKGFPLGMVSAYGPVKLVTGTVTGEVSLPFDAIMSANVTQNHPRQPTDGSYLAGPAGSPPVNFEMAFVNLQRYSQKLGELRNNGIVRFPSPSQMVLEGAVTTPGQPVVFNIGAMAFVDRYEIAYEVSGPSPTILVNVINTPRNSAGVKKVTLQSMGWVSKKGNLNHPEAILWNFVDAEELQISYMGFHGSILAPFANGRFYSGAMSGSVIAWSLMNDLEYYWAPFANYQKLDALRSDW